MRVRLIGHRQRKYPARLRDRLLAVMAPADTRTEELCALHAAVGDHFAAVAERTIRELAGQRGRVDLIGSHGQTICHLPPNSRRRGSRPAIGSTYQIGEPARIAARTGVTTVADFRQADIAAGGQGAPLVPWTDHVLFASSKVSRTVHNIGGISNVTYLPAGGKPDDVIAFDTGPGNMVIDALVRHFSRGRRNYDAGGRRAARGTIIEPVLRGWLRHAFLRRDPPKTTGREQFGQAFVARTLSNADHARRPGDDWIATATAFTARSVAHAYRRFLPDSVEEIILTGGGARNHTLIRMLAEALPEARIRTIDELSIPAAAKEAVSFAMLAAACVDRVPGNLPQVTGAKHPVILGTVTNAPT